MPKKETTKPKSPTTVKSSAVPKIKAIGEKPTKSQILKTIAEETGLPTKVVKQVFLATANLAKCHLVKKGSGEFTLPEIGVKIIRKTQPATKKRQGRNPLTGENITIAAKPKREVIRVKPLKRLKEILQ